MGEATGGGVNYASKWNTLGAYISHERAALRSRTSMPVPRVRIARKNIDGPLEGPPGCEAQFVLSSIRIKMIRASCPPWRLDASGFLQAGHHGGPVSERSKK